MSTKQFGGRITPTWRARYEASPNWKEGTFQNLTDTKSAINWRQIPGILCKQIKGHKEGYPGTDLPVAPLDMSRLMDDSGATRLVWYGHSVVMMRIAGQTLLIDPMLGPDASPIAPMKTRRFSSTIADQIPLLPEIDLMLISHDHYDHLDYGSIQQLKGKVRHYFVALGVKRHLVSWGIDASRIDEFDWWDSRAWHDIRITFTPTRHFSGRGMTSIAKCLWGGWALKTPSENVWFSGDSGYAGHFKEIGERLGPFDLGMMECGQYCVDWPEIHMFPEESVRAALDAGVRVTMPVHWGGFNLSYQHAWYEPAEEFVRHAEAHGVAWLTPGLGEVFDVGSSSGRWWEGLK